MNTIRELWASYRAILPRDAGSVVDAGDLAEADAMLGLERLETELSEFVASIGGEREP